MCGILAILNNDVIDQDDRSTLKRLIDARGPDYSSTLEEFSSECGFKFLATASVLHLRGSEIKRQPAVDDYGNVLLFNGQIYEYNGQALAKHVSDTSYLSDLLKECKSKIEIANVLSKIDGPFAFIYWHESLNCLFYGRDFFGRKSLCIQKSTEEGSEVPSIISSVALHKDKNNCDQIWLEVDCKGFHCLDLSCSDTIRTTYTWNIDSVYPRTPKCPPREIESKNEIIQMQGIPIKSLNQDMISSCDIDKHYRDSILDELGKVLLVAVRKRIMFNKDLCLKCRRRPIYPKCNHSKVAVAFSGGIDSTMLALALDMNLDKSQTIDLITVAFKDESPDRKSVGQAFKELRKLSPDRNWRLVICDISIEELQQKRKYIIRHLILPLNTVVDDSLGCGCWFIGRAIGRRLDSHSEDGKCDATLNEFLKYRPPVGCFDTECDLNINHYQSPASMIFAGMGIDEQLGGYSSHRAAWSKDKNRGLLIEISYQMRRLSSRNLGRDDRTLSHHGRDVKLPFLDYDLVSFLNKIPVAIKMDLSEPVDTGPKKILRELAQLWGLNETSRRVKRALQFGTRIARLEKSDEQASDICSRLI